MLDNSAHRMDRLRTRLGGLAFGGDYNPEQWPDEVRAEDLKLMKEAGVNFVNLAVFGWARVEPARDAFDFSYYDRVMDDLARHGITADLATMTASPPSWLAHEHPEILPVTADGVTRWPGTRQHYCPSSPVYRDRAAKLVEAVATHYRDHPALGLWHIGNEYGCHGAECFCDVSAEDFRTWLQARYGDVDAVNEAWSTDFWSQRYTGFEQILPPRSAPSYPNPAQALDYKRFSSDALRVCFETEREVLRRITPDVPVSTNFLAGHKPVDVYDWAPGMDVAGLDSYQDPNDLGTHHEAGFSYDSLRAARGGQPWLLMEQAAGAVNWRARNAPKAPGQNRLWSWQAVAQGADAVMYFQWRQSRGGAEKWHSGMVPHAGTDSRIFRETAALGRELAFAPELVGTTSVNEVAVLHDWNSWWALEQDSQPSDLVRHKERALDHYGPLFDLGIGMDVVHPDADLSGYKLVVLPGLYLLSSKNSEKIRDFVRDGGSVVVSFSSGIVDEHDRAYLGGYPAAPLREALGIRVEEFWPTEGTFGISGGSTADLWRDDVQLQGASSELTFTGAEWEGRPAATVHRFGSGTARYVATRPEPDAMRALLARACADAGVEPVLPGLPQGVQAARRTGPGVDVLLLLNHTDDICEVELPEERRDLLQADRPAVRSLVLAPRDVAVLLK